MVVLLVLGSPAALAELTDFTELSLEDLLEVRVIGASKYEQRQDEIVASVSVLTRADIEAHGWQTIDQALGSLPGVYTTYDRQYSFIGTRGFGLPGDFSTRVLLTINGNRVNDTVYDQAMFAREFPLSMSLVERIEFIPGPGGAVYGNNALFGVINVVTRSSDDIDGLEIESSIAAPDNAREGRISWGGNLAGDIKLLASAAVYESAGEDLLMTFPGAAEDGSDITGRADGLDGQKDKELMARVSKGPWSADLIYGDRRKEDPTGNYLSDPLSGGLLQDRHVLAQALYESPATDDAYGFVSRIFYNQYRYEQRLRYDTLFVSGGDSDTYGIDSRVVATPWTNHKVLFGLEYQVNARQDQSNKDLADPSNSLYLRGSGWRSGMYLQDEWRLLETVTATLGIRADRTDSSSTTLSPRIGLIWKPSPALLVKAMQGRAIRQPNAFERDFDDTGTSFTQVANPGLNHETINTLELSVDYRIRENMRLRLSGYRWQIDDLITLETDPAGTGASQYRSGDDIDARGLELSILQSWDWGAHLRASVSVQHADYANSQTLENSPEVLGKLNVSAPLPVADLRIGYELQYASKRLAIDRSSIDAYWLSNVQIAAEGWVPGLTLSLGIFNLFDEHYEHPGSEINWQTALEQDGRRTLLKLTYAR